MLVCVWVLVWEISFAKAQKKLLLYGKQREGERWKRAVTVAWLQAINLIKSRTRQKPHKMWLKTSNSTIFFFSSFLFFIFRQRLLWQQQPFTQLLHFHCEFLSLPAFHLQLFVTQQRCLVCASSLPPSPFALLAFYLVGRFLHISLATSKSCCCCSAAAVVAADYSHRLAFVKFHELALFTTWVVRALNLYTFFLRCFCFCCGS